MNAMHIFEILLLLAVVFFIVRSVYIETSHRKKGPYIKIGVYSGIAIFNIISLRDLSTSPNNTFLLYLTHHTI